MARLLFLGQTYELADSDDQFGTLVAGRMKCGRLTTYTGFAGPFRAAGMSVLQAGGDLRRDLNYQTQLGIVCEKCRRPLSETEKAVFIMHTINPGVVIGSFQGQQKVEACPGCNHSACHVLYDPDGFTKSRTGEVAYYLVYADLSRAREFFELIRAQLDKARGAEFSYHGVVELRTDPRSKDAPYPHYVVVHFKGVTSPAGLFDTFFESLDIDGLALNCNDHDMRAGAERIEQTNKGTRLHDSVVF